MATANTQRFVVYHYPEGIELEDLKYAFEDKTKDKVIKVYLDAPGQGTCTAELVTEAFHTIANIDVKLNGTTITLHPQVFNHVTVSLEDDLLELLSENSIKQKLEDLDISQDDCSLSGSLFSLQTAQNVIIQHILKQQLSGQGTAARKTHSHHALSNAHRQNVSNYSEQKGAAARAMDQDAGSNAHPAKQPELKQNLKAFNYDCKPRPKNRTSKENKGSRQPLKVSPEANGFSTVNGHTGISRQERHLYLGITERDIDAREDDIPKGVTKNHRSHSGSPLGHNDTQSQTFVDDGQSQNTGYHSSGAEKNRMTSFHPQAHGLGDLEENPHSDGTNTGTVQVRSTQIMTENGDEDRLEMSLYVCKDIVDYVFKRHKKKIDRISKEYGIGLTFEEKDQVILLKICKTSRNPPSTYEQTAMKELAALFQNVTKVNVGLQRASQEERKKLISLAKGICSQIEIEEEANDTLSLIGPNLDVQRIEVFLSQKLHANEEHPEIHAASPYPSSYDKLFMEGVDYQRHSPQSASSNEESASQTAVPKYSSNPIHVDIDIWDYLMTYHKEKMDAIERERKVFFQCKPDGDLYKLCISTSPRSLQRQQDFEDLQNEIIGLYQKLFDGIKKEEVNLRDVSPPKSEFIQKNVETAKGKYKNILFKRDTKKVTLMGPPEDIFKAKSWMRAQLGLTPRRSKSLDRGHYRRSSQERSRPTSPYDNKQPTGRQSRRGSFNVKTAKKCNFFTNESIKLVVYKGDITKDDAYAVVSAANAYLQNGAGVAGAISKAAGGYTSLLEKECKRYIRERGQLSVGNTMDTSAGGQLRCCRVIHAVGPMMSESETQCKSEVFATFMAVLKHAENKLYADTIAIPLISSGIFGMPVDIAASALGDAIHQFSRQRKGAKFLKEIRLVNIIDEAVTAIKSAFKSIFLTFPTDSDFSGIESHRSIEAKRARETRRKEPSKVLADQHTAGDVRASLNHTRTIKKQTGEITGTQYDEATRRSRSKIHSSESNPQNRFTDIHRSPNKEGSRAAWADSSPESDKMHPFRETYGSLPQQGAQPGGWNAGHSQRLEISSYIKCAQCKAPVEMPIRIPSDCDHILCKSCFSHPAALQGCLVCAAKSFGVTSASKQTSTVNQKFSAQRSNNMKTSQAFQVTADIPLENSRHVSKDMVGVQGAEANSSDPDNCVICMCEIDNPKTLSKCKHTFCSACIDGYFKQGQPKCPVCGEIYGTFQGDQPSDGTMDIQFDKTLRLPGFETPGAYVIDYYFPSGTQEGHHPNPGREYRGISRRAYLPYCREGKHVLTLLEKAFDAKVMFTIGHSRTTGKEGVITWNDIHHKTSISGGPTNFGYPDPGYLQRVTEELAAKGIK